MLTHRPEVQPISFGLLNMVGTHCIQWNIVMAGAFLAAMPTLPVCMLVSRFFVSGIMSWAVKG